MLQIPRRPKDVGVLEFYTRSLLGPQGDVFCSLGLPVASTCPMVPTGASYSTIFVMNSNIFVINSDIFEISTDIFAVNGND